MYSASNHGPYTAASSAYSYSSTPYYSQYSQYSGYQHTADPSYTAPSAYAAPAPTAEYHVPTSVIQHNPYSQAVFQQYNGNRVASVSPVRAPIKSAFAAAQPMPIAADVHTDRYASSKLLQSHHQHQQRQAQQHHSQQHHSQQQHQQQHHDAQSEHFASQGAVTTADLLLHVGQFEMLARTPTGSSFIQSALKDGCDPANVALVWSELEQCFVDLLLDAHGCYVLKSLMERMDEEALHRVIAIVVRDEQLCFSMCTHSLHTRRVAQFLIERDVSIMSHLLVSKCREIGMTQQGCIIMQKAMDLAVGPLRNQLYDAIITNFVDFALDPFANYIVQHLLEIGTQDVQPENIVRSLGGRIGVMSCNKYASNVIEKCLFHLPTDAQHSMITEMYNVDEEVLFQMLQDSFGNYIIQSSIALANFRDIWMISEKLRNVLQRTPYGHKIEARLERRLKGKSVLSRGGPQHPGAPTRGRQQRSRNSEYSGSHQQEPW